MKNRCYNKNDDSYEWYGARGVKVCDEWHDAKKFIDWALANDYTDELTIDRLDDSLGYSSDNCRWITNTENVIKSNLRNTFGKNKHIKLSESMCDEIEKKYKETNMSIRKLAKEYGVSYTAVQSVLAKRKQAEAINA